MAEPTGLYIPSYASLKDHPKTRKLARLLDIPRVQAIGHLHCLWWWAMTYAQDGELHTFDNEDLAVGAEWDGDAASFTSALCSAGFVIGERLHNWDRYGGRVLHGRQRKAESQRRYREERSRSGNVDATLPLPDDHVTAKDKNRQEESRQEETTTLSTDSDESVGGEDEVPETAQVRYTDDFEAFWRSYPRGRGNKKPSFAAWRKLRKADREKAVAALDDWLDCDLWQDVTKVKYCERWLRDHCFADPPPNGISPNGNGRAGTSVSDALYAEEQRKLKAIEEHAIATGEPFGMLQKWLDEGQITEDQYDQVTTRLTWSKP
jgi:hypothetical protein